MGSIVLQQAGLEVVSVNYREVRTSCSAMLKALQSDVRFQTPIGVSVRSSLTHWDKEGWVSSYVLTDSEGRVSEYKFETPNRRMLQARYPNSVVVTGPAVHAVIDTNNLAAIRALLERARFGVPTGETVSYRVLIPENNRSVEVPISHLNAEVTAELLGMRLVVDSGGNAERRGRLIALSPGITSSESPVSGAQLTVAENLTEPSGRELQSSQAVAYFLDEPPGLQHTINESDAVQSTVWTPQKRRRGLVLFMGGSGEYASNGYTRLGLDLGYGALARRLSESGFQMASLARRRSRRIPYETLRAAILNYCTTLVDEAGAGDDVVLVGHSLGGLLMADVAQHFSGRPIHVVLIATPARGLRRTIRNQVAYSSPNFAQGSLTVKRRFCAVQRAAIDSFFDREPTTIPELLRNR